MRTEIIQNPDVGVGLRYWEDLSPKFSHFQVEHGDPLQSSVDPIISGLIADGWEVHATHTTFFMGFPTAAAKLDKHFAAQDRYEYQIKLGDDGFLRFRMDYPQQVYLTLFYIAHNKQGKGLARHYFKTVTDALFRAGVVFMLGAVSPSYYPVRKPMDRNRLIRFYVREAGFMASQEGWVWKFTPYTDNLIDSDLPCIVRPENTFVQKQEAFCSLTGLV